MNTNRSTRKPRTEAPESLSPVVATVMEQHFDGLSQKEPVVEHLTIPGFLRRLDHKWDLDDIRRFGDKVRTIATAMDLAYVPKIDASLGVLRAFPVPMMDRIYNTLRGIHGWPELPGNDVASDELQKTRRQLRDTERAVARMREMIAETDDVETAQTMTKSLDVLEAKVVQLKTQAALPVLPRN